LNWEIRSAWNSSWIRFQRALSIAAPRNPAPGQFVWRSLVPATPWQPPVAMDGRLRHLEISAFRPVEPAEEAAFDHLRLTGFDLCQLFERSLQREQILGGGARAGV